jgi:mannosyl-oligosaccharide alpha-1,2-mannosidase
MTAPAGLDSSDILIAAWIYLDDASMLDNDMRTVFSNKMPGCGIGSGNYGLSLFVNAWQTNDHKLYVEYGGKSSGCHKVDSGSVLLEPKRWYHVALYTTTTVMDLYIDGTVVNSSPISEAHEVQETNPMFVGVYDTNAEYPLNGNISHFAVMHDLAAQSADPASTVMQLRESASAPGLHALYSLTDAASEVPNTAAKDALQAHTGKYTFPVVSSNILGVKIALVDGVGNREVTEEMRQASDKEGRIRRESVKRGMQHAWAGYKKYAWGRDEVKPLSNQGQDNWGGMGVTLVDSLDTLWLMGMKEEFAEARDWVANSLSFDRAGTVSVFETTIRELGGLLSAYDLSKDQVFLQKAQLLADKLTPAFQTQSGIPMGMVNFRNGAASGGWSGSNAILSELGSLQIEFRYLAEKVKERSYETKSMKPFQVMYQKHPANGLYPIKVSTRDGAFADTQVTFGALGDSFYEYLLKVWLQGGRKEPWLREMYDKAMDGVMDKLLLASDVTGLAFLADWNGRHNNRKMDHLVCFMPGALALGAYTDPNGLESDRAKRDLAVAKALMYTCYQMYHRMASGIAAEYVEFPSHQDFIPGPNAGFYILRPETAESMFILNKLTGDPIYRDWAWEIWEAIDRTCKTDTAYGAIRNVNQRGGGGIDDRMESFFLAETLKYLYLAQDPDTEIDLMKVVFNTEAHPMHIFDDSHIPIKSS